MRAEERMWESLVSFPDTTMAGGAKARPRGRLAPGKYPGHNLSLTEALHAVSMKLSQADDLRYVHVARRFSIPLKASHFAQPELRTSNGLSS